MNKLIAVGRLGQDAVLRYSGQGTPLVNFSVATRRKVAGEERTTWINATLFGKRAEALAPYMTKGTTVYCEGFFENRRYTHKDGVERDSWGLAVDDVQLIGTRPGQAANATHTDAAAAPSPIFKPSLTESDIPF